MPLFFFDTDDGELRYRDERGLDLPSALIASREADKLIADLAHFGLKAGGQPRTITATVRDASGIEVYRAAVTLISKRSLH